MHSDKVCGCIQWRFKGILVPTRVLAWTMICWDLGSNYGLSTKVIVAVVSMYSGKLHNWWLLMVTVQTLKCCFSSWCTTYVSLTVSSKHLYCMKVMHSWDKYAWLTTPNKEYVTDLDGTDDISLVSFNATPWLRHSPYSQQLRGVQLQLVYTSTQAADQVH